MRSDGRLIWPYTRSRKIIVEPTVCQSPIPLRQSPSCTVFGLVGHLPFRLWDILAEPIRTNAVVSFCVEGYLAASLLAIVAAPGTAL